MAVDKLKYIKNWLPVLLWMVFIFYMSSIPGSNIPSLFAFQDIAFHLFVYLMLGLSFSMAFRKTFPAPPLKIILFTVIFGFIYGSSDEFHQSFVPYRSVSGLDLLVDSLGCLIGSLIYR